MIIFFDLWKQALNMKPHLILEFGYNRITDWNLNIYDATGCGIGEAINIIQIQEIDINRVFASAYIKLTDWLSENCGGY